MLNNMKRTKSIQTSPAVYLWLLLALLISNPMLAQKNSSKSKSSDKIYEKGEINKNVILKNAVMINTEKLEFSPTFYENGIVYVSSRYKSGAVDKKIGETFFELFYAELDRNGNPLEPESFSVNMNSQVHEGPVTFDNSNQKVFFTRNNSKNGVRQADAQGVTRLKIYEATRGHFDWEEMTELPFNSDDYSTCHPSLSTDGRRLYFTSDMPGGYGGFDLYMVERRGESWSVPINLGPDINTEGNDVFPFIHDSGTLFFSSDGQGGYGGLDIYMINLTSQSWGKVMNLGIPFNSPRDDLGFILHPDGEYGFLTSDRAGGYGKDDIYRFELPEGLNGMKLGLELTSKIIAYDQNTQQRIQGAEVRIFERSSDGFIEGNEVYDIQLIPSEPGSNEMVMKLIRKEANDMGEPLVVTNPNGEAIYTLKAEKDYLILVSKDGYSNGEVLYSTAGETTPQTIRVPLRTEICTKLSGTVSVTNFETPIPNAMVRVMNRCNGEEKILRSDAEGQFEYCLPPGCDFSIIVEKDGYTDGSSEVSTKNVNPKSVEKVNVSLEMNPIAESILKNNETIAEGSVIVLENIYYDFNKSAIRSGAARELDALAQLMTQYPKMEIEMIAHTDSRGSEKYNMDLSLQRAESAKKYLVARGIQSSRIKAFGYGETKLRNHCKNGVNCSEEEHQFNRRTEVRVSKMAKGMEIQYKNK
jgi:outer membrane protein OmpA-like peptidoglycan-associated protein